MRRTDAATACRSRRPDDSLGKSYADEVGIADAFLGALGLAARQEPGKQPAMPWLVAHRGASAYAPENTVPAFVLAAEQGATFVEFDFQLTKGRRIVVLHDNSLERTTNIEEVFPDRSGHLKNRFA